MNKQLRTLLAFSAIGISTAALPAYCGEFEAIHVTVPFAFVAGTTTLPAGDYTVTETGAHAVLIHGNHASAIVLASAGEESEGDATSLGFQRTQKGVYLKTVRSAGRPVSVLLLAPEIEK
ncbi:MAG: hypothetical protein M3N54_03100 [Acidobacteriota bacterium]|nr:hypothetical protein [Acidobacteriota bacterium]